MKRLLKTLIPCLIFTCAGFYASAQAQPDYTVILKDSLQATDTLQWLSNDVRIRNDRTTVLNIRVHLNLPPQWQVVGKQDFNLSINPGETKLLPLNIIKQPQALAKWQPAELVVEDEHGTLSKKTFPFYLRANPISLWELTTTSTEITVLDNTKYIIVEATVRNNGNIDENLDLTARSDFFELNKIVNKTIAAGEEYTFTNRIHISNALRKSMSAENVRISVRNKLQKSQALQFNVVNLSNDARQHTSKYPTIPMQLETGLMYFSKTFTGYVGFNGAIALKDSQQINFSYRTKQLGIANTIEKNAFSIEYNNRNWKLYAGQLSSTRSFFSFGQGISATYRGKNEHEVNVTGILHYKNNPYKADLFAVTMRNKLGKSILKSGAEVNANKSEKKYAYVITNDLDLIKKDKLQLSFNFNLGQTHYMHTLDKPGAEKLAVVYGYSAMYRVGNVQFGSDYFHGGALYPGIMGGTINQHHRISWQLKRVTFDAYYRYNTINRKNLLFIDTVFNTNFFDYNFEQYGLRTRIVLSKSTDVTVGLGQYKQTGFDRNLLHSAKFVDLAGNYRKGRNFSIRFNSANGFGAAIVPGKEKQNIVISRTNISTNYKFIGMSAFYYRTPRSAYAYSQDSSSLVSETMSITPFVNLRFSRAFTGSVNYSVAKSLFDDVITTFAGVNLVYNNKRNGLYATLAGNLPVSNTSENFSALANNSVILSVRKDLSVPNIFKRKYYDLKIVLFKDENLNNKYDDGEEGINDVTINIVSQRMFITDRKGVAMFKNAEKKYYVIDVASTKAPRGYIPASGHLHYINLQKNGTLEIPYHKGKVIAGKVTVTLDSLTLKQFRADKLKVMAIDTLGNTYKSLTDANGNYFINVPPGWYKVSLNPDAYTKDLKPVQMFFIVDMNKPEDEQTVNFEIKENKRQIRFLNSGSSTPANGSTQPDNNKKQNK
ncbi:MAG TPA: hypothetical protein VHM26_09695 [Chitinophagaceae bacterium]|nr:hypothetical protein [Chitinophagaceae bacterium]